jgi:hypothetical protein
MVTSIPVLVKMLDRNIGIPENGVITQTGEACGV